MVWGSYFIFVAYPPCDMNYPSHQIQTTPGPQFQLGAERTAQTAVSGTLLSWALEPDCRILVFILD